MKSRGETERYCPDHMALTRKLNSSATSPPLPSGLVLVDGERRRGWRKGHCMKVCREREGRVEGNEGRRVGKEKRGRENFKQEKFKGQEGIGKKWRKEREGGKVR